MNAYKPAEAVAPEKVYKANCGCLIIVVKLERMAVGFREKVGSGPLLSGNKK